MEECFTSLPALFYTENQAETWIENWKTGGTVKEIEIVGLGE